MVLLDNRPDLQVLMLLRNNSSGFVASHTIFPGGAIEQDDRSYMWDDLVTGLTNEEADTQQSPCTSRVYPPRALAGESTEQEEDRAQHVGAPHEACHCLYVHRMRREPTAS